MDCVAYLAADFQLTRDVQTQTFWRLRPSAHCGDEQNFEWASISLNTWWVQENKKYNSSKNRDLQIWTDLFSFCYNPHVWQTDRRTDRQLSPVCLSRHSSCLRGIHDLREACSSASTSAISTLVCVHLCLHISIPYATIIPAAVDFDRPTSLRVRGSTNSHRSGRSILCCCVYGTTLTPRTSEFRRLPKKHLCAEDHSHYVLLILFIYLIYQSTAWQSKNNKHQINAIPGLNGQCRDSPLKHGQHKG